MTFLILALLANLWIYKILFANFFLAVLAVLCTILLHNSIERHKKTKLYLLVFILLLLFQITTTKKVSLTSIANDDRRLIDLRLRAYPPQLLRVGHWLEERKESVMVARITRNLFENLDPNLYFFANHPRERVGVREFEKFPYIFLPFFLIGLVKILQKLDKHKILLISFLIPLILLSLIGNQNEFGPLALFPFFAVTISLGLPRGGKFGVLILALVLIQMIAYEIY